MTGEERAPVRLPPRFDSLVLAHRVEMEFKRPAAWYGHKELKLEGIEAVT